MHEAAKHAEAARKAAVEVIRAQSASTAKTKQQQALRCDGQSIKAGTEGAKIIASINKVMACLAGDHQRLDQTPRESLRYSENY
jgi:hypothetical protein